MIEGIVDAFVQSAPIAVGVWIATKISRYFPEVPKRRIALSTLLVALLVVSGYFIHQTGPHPERLAPYIVWAVSLVAFVASVLLLAWMYQRPRVLGQVHAVQDELVIELQMLLNRRFGDRYRVIDRVAGGDLELTVTSRSGEQPVAPPLTIPFETLDEATHTAPFEELVTEVETHFAASGGSG